MKCRDCENLIWSYDEGEWIWHCRECYCPDLDIERDCPDFALKKSDIFTALSTLQAENEKLRAELERVKRERDAAVKVIERVRSCKDCGHYTGEWTPPCKECQDSEEHHPYFKWRGQKED